ncbi:MAG: serine/threonine protein kinase, partial [Planctomycetota bacterium]
MPTQKDVLFLKVALKNRILDMDRAREGITIQGEMEKLGIQKSVAEVLMEQGYLNAELVQKIFQAVKLSEEILQKRLAEKKFYREIQEKKEVILENLFQEMEGSTLAVSLQKEKKTSQPISNPFEKETESFYLSPEGEIEAVMLLQKLKEIEPSKESQQMEKIFGKYRILSKLGQGGQSEVYKALDTTRERLVALKIIKPDIAKDREFIERFHREARHLKRFNHPNIVKIYDAGIIHERHYLAMEYIEGETLSERARRAPLSIPEACEIVKQICQGLLVAHSKLVVHRDIKMSNILLAEKKASQEMDMEGDFKYVVKIADFGLAKSKKDTKVTQQNQFMGTAKYLPPEQIKYGEFTEKSDIFALGIIFYELLAHEEPFKATSSIGYLHANVEDEPVPPRRLNPQISESLEKAVMKALEKDPAKRYNAPALLRDLERLEKDFWGMKKIVEHQDRESAFYVGHLEEKRLQRKKLVFRIGAMMLILLLAGTFYYWRKMSLINRARLLVEKSPQESLRILQKMGNFWIDPKEKKKIIRQARYYLLWKKAKSLEQDDLWYSAIEVYQKILKEFPEKKKEVLYKLRFAQYKELVNRAKEREIQKPVEGALLYRQAIRLQPELSEAKQNLEAMLLRLKSQIQKEKDLKHFDKVKKLYFMQSKIDPKFHLKKALFELELEKILYEIEELK